MGTKFGMGTKFCMGSKFGMGTKFCMEMSNIKEKIENDLYIINYAWFVKTSPVDLEFCMDDGVGI